MIVTLIVGLFSVLFAYLTKYKHGQWGLRASFTLIFFFLALRYDFGNDYKAYLDNFVKVSNYKEIDYFGNTQSFDMEMGWIYLNWFFRSFGFFAMTAVLALFNCVVYYCFIKKYIPVSYYWLAIFIYVFYPEFMLIHSSAMRQSVAIILFIFSLDYLYKKDAIRYFLCIGLASLFHISAVILLPVYLIGLFNWKFGKVIGVVLISIYVSVFLFVKSLSPYLILFVSNYFEKYVGYQDEGAFDSGLGVLYFSIMFILTLYFVRLQNKEIALVFKIAILSYMLMPMNLMIALAARFAMYFAPATIIVFPIIVMNLKNPISKTICVAAVLISTTYKFFQFFNSVTYEEYFGIYHTIFSAPQWY